MIIHTATVAIMNYVRPQRNVQVLTPGTVTVTLFGKRVFADVIKLK